MGKRMNSKTIYPVKKEETLRDFLVKKNLNDIPKKEYLTIFDRFLGYLLKATRFNDISDLIRAFNQKKNWIENFSDVVDRLTIKKKFILHFPAIVTFNYFLETFLNAFEFIESYYLIQKSLHAFLLTKKKFKSDNFLIKKLTKKVCRMKKPKIFLTIMNHESSCTQKSFIGVQGYLGWFYLSLEKSFESNYYKGKFNFSLGKVALIQNKKIKAFSFFIQSLEDFNKRCFKSKMIIIEWFILTSFLLKKINQTNKFTNGSVLPNSKNIFQIKTIYNCIKKNNMALLEKLIFSKDLTPINLSSSYLLMKKFFKKIKKKINNLLSIFVRSPIYHFAMRL